MKDRLRLRLAVVRISNRQRNPGNNCAHQRLRIYRKYRANIRTVVSQRLRSLELIDSLQMNLHPFGRIRKCSFLRQQPCSTPLRKHSYSRILTAQILIKRQRLQRFCGKKQRIRLLPFRFKVGFVMRRNRRRSLGTALDRGNSEEYRNKKDSRTYHASQSPLNQSSQRTPIITSRNYWTHPTLQRSPIQLACFEFLTPLKAQRNVRSAHN